MSNMQLTSIIFVPDNGEPLVSVTMMAGFWGMNIGDIYSLKTHKTDFNDKVKVDIPDGEYVVFKRLWSHHLAEVNGGHLYIYIQKQRKPLK